MGNLITKWPVHCPGVSIRRSLDNKGMTQKEFALRMGYSEKFVSHLLNGSAALSLETASRLESVLEKPASHWNRLETEYREDIARREQEAEMLEELAVADLYPFTQMQEAHWVGAAESDAARVRELRRFFHVARLSSIPAVISEELGRPVPCATPRDFAFMACVQRAKNEGLYHSGVQPYIERLLDILGEYRLSSTKPMRDFAGWLEGETSSCGMQLLYYPDFTAELPNAFTVRTKGCVVIAVRAKDVTPDAFWLPLFFEFWRVIEGLADRESLTRDEEALLAHRVRDSFVPPAVYAQFVKAGSFTEERVRQLAKDCGTHPAIIVGLLQQDGVIPANRMNKLKPRMSQRFRPERSLW